LIKPQFEAGKHAVDRGEGVIQDPAVHRQVLEDVLNFAQASGYGVSGLMRSPLKGPKGNSEFLAYLKYPTEKAADVGQMVAAVMEES
jgi:23S rRNA (cytidine1920-2'-O)/16S rRNA (cytidine1409-2'-O)-methyltransferase